MILTLTDDDGVVLDSTKVTRHELEVAQSNGPLAKSILASLSPGDNAK